jgi:general secretion pathway protein M
MTSTLRHIEHRLMRHRSIPALLYVAVVLTFLLTVVLAVLDLGQAYRTVKASGEILAELESRNRPAAAMADAAVDAAPSGSPFLQGETVTLASAALLQRINGAIAAAGGDVVSSQVEAQTSQSKDYVKVSATCELEQAALQGLLYDLEAGMPFLFVDQLSVQSATSANEGGRLRVLLGVSGLWRAAK